MKMTVSRLLGFLSPNRVVAIQKRFSVTLKKIAIKTDGKKLKATLL